MQVQLDNLKLEATREGYGKGLVELGEKNENVVALSADLPDSTRAIYFKERFPERYFEVGIQEQNMFGIAAGLALAGKIPFASSFACFCERGLDQLRVTVCYSNLNVKICGSHAGLLTGEDGASQMGIEDIAVFRTLPNMKVVMPCDFFEAKKATFAAAETYGPIYIRTIREKTPIITTEEDSFEIGKAEIFRDGSDVTIIACGASVYESLVAARKLEEEGIDARVINNHTIKPLDRNTLVKAARDTGAFVTVEDHQIHGGMGSAVAELIVENYPVPMKMVGIKDKFGESGKSYELWDKYGLSSKFIVEAVENVLKMKGIVSKEFHRK